mgnify:CR=1 FL=1
MVNIRQKVIIDLSKYGGNGEVVMGEPSLRQQTIAGDAIGQRTALDKNNKPLMEGTKLVSIEIINTLSYVKSAPFKPDLDSFLKFTDELEEKDGDSNGLYSEMRQTAKDIREGKHSPFVSSPAAETPNSE